MTAQCSEEMRGPRAADQGYTLGKAKLGRVVSSARHCRLQAVACNTSAASARSKISPLCCLEYIPSPNLIQLSA